MNKWECWMKLYIQLSSCKWIRPWFQGAPQHPCRFRLINIHNNYANWLWLVTLQPETLWIADQFRKANQFQNANQFRNAWFYHEILDCVIFWLSQPKMVGSVPEIRNSSSKLCSHMASHVQFANARYSELHDERAVEVCLQDLPR